MSDIQFPENTVIISTIDLIPNAQNQLAALDNAYDSGVAIYIANNSPFTTALVNIEVIPDVNENVNYEPLYTQSVFIPPQQVLIISNLFNSANTIINITVNNCNNAVAYAVYNPEFVALSANSSSLLPIVALINENVSSTPTSSGGSENYSVLQEYVTTQIDNLTTDVSNLSSIITDNFSELLNAVNFEQSIQSLSSEVQETSSQLTSEVTELSSYISSTVPLISTFINTTAPEMSTKFDLLGNQVLANYQTFTTEIANLNTEVDNDQSNIQYLSSEIDQTFSELIGIMDDISSLTSLTSASSSNYIYLQSEIATLSAQVETNIPFMSSIVDSISDNVNSNNAEISSLKSQVQDINVTLENDTTTIESLTAEVVTLSSQIESLSSSINIEEIQLLETNVTTLFNEISNLQNNLDSYENSSGSNIRNLSSASIDLSSDIQEVSGSLINGTLTPKFDYVQRQVDRNSQNWLPNSTFLYGLLLWNSSVPGASATTDSQMTSLTYQSTNTSLQKIQSDPITAQWIDSTEQPFTLSAQISSEITSSTPTIDVLCYDVDNNLLGSAGTIAAPIGLDYSGYVVSGKLLEYTTSVVIELGFSGDATMSYVGFSEIKFEYNDIPTQWSDEASSMIINKLYSQVFGVSAIVAVSR